MFATRCESDDACESGDCLSRIYSTNSWTGAYSFTGFCSQVCVSDADCPANSGCVDLPCVGASTDESRSCGTHCLPKCSESTDCIGTCHTMTTAQAVIDTFCDPRRGDNQACNSADDCVSDKCGTGNTCTPIAGKANGSACLTSTECASSNCVGGACRGKSLMGDPCTVANDCSVGCCSGLVCTSC